MNSFCKLAYIFVVHLFSNSQAYSIEEDYHLLVNGRSIDIRKESSVFSEWPRDWFGLLSQRELAQWYVKVQGDVDVRQLEDSSGLSLGLYFPHNGYLLVSSQVTILHTLNGSESRLLTRWLYRQMPVALPDIQECCG